MSRVLICWFIFVAATPAYAAMLAEFTYTQTDFILNYNGPRDRLNFGFNLVGGPGSSYIYGTYTTADVGRVIAASPEMVAVFNSTLRGTGETWIYTSALMSCDGSACSGSHGGQVLTYPFYDYGQLVSAVYPQAVGEMTYFTPNPASWEVSAVEMTIDQVAITLIPTSEFGDVRAESIGAHRVRFYDATPAATQPGDYSGDGIVDAADYIVWRNQLGSLVPQCSGADANCNGVVDNLDYQTWKANFGQSVPSGAIAAAVPEPSGVGGLMLCLAGLWHVRRRHYGG